MTLHHPLDIVTRDVPSLWAWWGHYRAEPDYDPTLTRLHMNEFTLHVLDQVRDGRIPNFDDIVRGIETALAEAKDDQSDAIGLSIIETLLTNAERHALDLRSLYAALGPRARQQWEDLYAYLHNGRKWPNAAA